MSEKNVVKFLSKGLVEGSDSRVFFRLQNGKLMKLDVGALSEELQLRLAVHGALQKVGDAAASFSKEKDVAGAEAAMQAVIDCLESGQWERPRSGGVGVSHAVVAERAVARQNAYLQALTSDPAKLLAFVQLSPEAQRAEIEAWEAEQASEPAPVAEIVG